MGLYMGGKRSWKVTALVVKNDTFWLMYKFGSPRHGGNGTLPYSGRTHCTAQVAELQLFTISLTISALTFISMACEPRTKKKKKYPKRKKNPLTPCQLTTSQVTIISIALNHKPSQSWQILTTSPDLNSLGGEGKPKKIIIWGKMRVTILIEQSIFWSTLSRIGEHTTSTYWRIMTVFFKKFFLGAIMVWIGTLRRSLYLSSLHCFIFRPIEYPLIAS